VIGTSVVLRDLNSTNGTYVNEQKITAENLDNQSEFRIGSTIFMLIMTDVE
jgi:pSer/pThr/pTyr-binding forkhead associated (FHA) protein